MVPSFLLGLLGQPFLLLLPCKSGSALSASLAGSSPASAPTWLLPGLCSAFFCSCLSEGPSCHWVFSYHGCSSNIPHPQSHIPRPKGFHTDLVNKLTSVFIPMALYGGSGYFSLDEYTQILYPSMVINSVHYILIRNFWHLKFSFHGPQLNPNMPSNQEKRL